MKLNFDIPEQTVADLETGWAINYDFLREIESIVNPNDSGKDLSLSDIESVILALQQISEK